MQSDIILDSFVKNYANNLGLDVRDTSRAFESFVASSLLRKYHQCEIADIENETLVGGGGDGGIDAISILINGRPVRSNEDVDFFIQKLGRPEVQFVFMQAKYSPHFRSADIGNFLYGVAQFFSDQPEIDFNDEVIALKEVTAYIYENSPAMDTNPECHCYFATAGSWRDNADLRGRMRSGQRTLEEKMLFSKVEIYPVDSAGLRTISRELEHGVSRTVELSKTAVFPNIEGVDQAYIGLLPGNEFIKLVSREDGHLNRDLFYDNVRDFQGENPVNKEIHDTLSHSRTKNRFPLLNNGVTIVARSVTRTGDNFTIRDFQIVNGCQTTYVLHLNREKVDANLFVPVKILTILDGKVTDDVIKGTNRQTAVLPEALESLTLFHKDLEEYYVHRSHKAFDETFYYERRSKQYLLENISSRNVVTLTAQTKSFVAMFLNEPHSHPRYYGELLASYRNRLFLPDHRPESYFASGVSLIALERILNLGELDRSLRRYKYHVLMMLRIQIAGADLPNLNSAKIAQYVDKIIDCIRDTDRFESECKKAIRRIREQLGRGSFRKDSRNPPDRLRAFTMALLAAFGPKRVASQLEHGAHGRGRIDFFDPWKNIGAIVDEHGERIYFEGKQVRELPLRLRRKGTRVDYDLHRDSYGRKAVGITLTKG